MHPSSAASIAARELVLWRHSVVTNDDMTRDSIPMCWIASTFGMWAGSAAGWPLLPGALDTRITAETCFVLGLNCLRRGFWAVIFRLFNVQAIANVILDIILYNQFKQSYGDNILPPWQLRSPLLHVGAYLLPHVPNTDRILLRHKSSLNCPPPRYASQQVVPRPVTQEGLMKIQMSFQAKKNWPKRWSYNCFTCI